MPYRRIACWESFGERRTRGLRGNHRDLAVANAEFTDTTSPIYAASGRLYFTVGTTTYVCSGTALNYVATGLSLVLTAGHCVYDDINFEWAQPNSLFIPHGDEKKGDGYGTSTDLSTYCATHFQYGCWELEYGVVEARFADGDTFPLNLGYDWGVYVAKDVDHYPGTDSTQLSSLRAAVGGGIDYDFTSSDPCGDPASAGFGYPIADTVNNDNLLDLRYCTDDAGNYTLPYGTTSSIAWHLPGCYLTGGGSGGGLLCENTATLGSGKLFSTQSFGFGSNPGNGYPKMFASEANCGLVTAASASTTGYTMIDTTTCSASPSTSSPTKSPTPAPSKSPTKSPTPAPSESPTVPAPTKAPTPAPSNPPTKLPTPAPSESPTVPAPTPSPTDLPTPFPTNRPTPNPTNQCLSDGQGRCKNGNNCGTKCCCAGLSCSGGKDKVCR